jgi:hypothetical protein
VKIFTDDPVVAIPVLGIVMMIPIPLSYIYACTTCTCHNWPTRF